MRHQAELSFKTEKNILPEFSISLTSDDPAKPYI